MAVRVRDNGATKLLKTITGQKATVSVGIIGTGASALTSTGTTLAQVAVWMEFGTTKDGEEVVPARPFIRGYVDANEELIKKKMLGAAKLVAKNKDMTARQALGLVGLFVEEGIRELIDEGIPPELKTATIAAKRRKGYPKPNTALVGTRQLYMFITHEVGR